MNDTYDTVTDVACPYTNCGAGAGMKCVVHCNDGTNKLRDSPHAARVRAADDRGLIEQTDEEAELIEELEQEIKSMEQ